MNFEYASELGDNPFPSVKLHPPTTFSIYFGIFYRFMYLGLSLTLDNKHSMFNAVDINFPLNKAMGENPKHL